MHSNIHDDDNGEDDDKNNYKLKCNNTRILLDWQKLENKRIACIKGYGEMQSSTY